MSDIVKRLDRLANAEIIPLTTSWEISKAASKEITRLRAENEKLRDALRPFAGLMLVDELKWADYKILTDDIRAAAAAIRESGAKP